MKTPFILASNRRLRAASLKTGLAFVLVFGLAPGFWFASLPIARAAQITPAEMIHSKLPANTTLSTATAPQLLEAVCKAVKQWPRDAGLIVRVAAGARQNLRVDILCAAIRCARESHSLECSWVLDVVREWTNANPSLANQLIESVGECAPDCRDALQSSTLGEGNFTNPPININPPPGSVGGGGGGNVCLVCHNGNEIQIACSDLDNYLRSHPGDHAGPCQPTPITNP